jgi:hypothetical protein
MVDFNSLQSGALILYIKGYVAKIAIWKDGTYYQVKFDKGTAVAKVPTSGGYPIEDKTLSEGRLYVYGERMKEILASLLEAKAMGWKVVFAINEDTVNNTNIIRYVEILD